MGEVDAGIGESEDGEDAEGHPGLDPMFQTLLRGQCGGTAVLQALDDAGQLVIDQGVEALTVSDGVVQILASGAKTVGQFVWSDTAPRGYGKSQ